MFLMLDTPHTFLARHTVNNLKIFLTVKSHTRVSTQGASLT